MYKLRIVFTGLVCLHHDEATKTFWALFFQPQSSVREKQGEATVFRDVPSHVTRLFGPGVEGPQQPQVIGHSSLAGFVGRRYLELKDHHLTLKTGSTDKTIGFYDGDEDGGRRKYSWVVSIPELLRKHAGVASSLKDELTRKPYAGSDLIARLELTEGIVRTAQLWGEEANGPWGFRFDANSPVFSPLARKVAVELQIEGEAALMTEGLHAGGQDRKKLLSFNGEHGDVVVDFVTAPLHHSLSDANHFRGFYKLFGDLQGLDKVLPAPFTPHGHHDGDGACSPGKSG